MKTHWRLPRGVDELLPPAAWELESLRRRVLDVFDAWGFDYVEPPVIEYLESLLVGSGEDMDLQTLKVIDQVSGKQLGVRADMTSQAVRIDAHSRVTDDVQRLCYAGPVVLANPQIAQSSRVPFKAGAEIFGAGSLDADAEIISLMLEAVRAGGVQQPVLLLGHMGIYHGLASAAVSSGALAEEDELTLFGKIQRKSESDIRELLDESPIAEMIAQLPRLMGEIEVLDQARDVLSGAPDAVLAAIAQLEDLARMVRAANNDVQVGLDVAELSGYGYHNGPVFAVYHPQRGSAVAQGGRYDGVGDVFGRGRPATGFDMDLKGLIGGTSAARPVVFAPYVTGAARSKLIEEVGALRAQGYRVRCALSATEQVPAGCSQLLVENNGRWQLAEVPT